MEKLLLKKNTSKGSKDCYGTSMSLFSDKDLAVSGATKWLKKPEVMKRSFQKRFAYGLSVYTNSKNAPFCWQLTKLTNLSKIISYLYDMLKYVGTFEV